ncbi:MAG: branched-chain amino acid transporter permease [Anaerovoracaceae bacterium]|jgi:branched-subunit amino acid transport protein AzlD
MSPIHAILTILTMALGVALMRAFPFILFPAGRQIPPYINYISIVLPCATMGMLVIYCLRYVNPLSWPFGIPELIGIAIVVLIQLWRSSVLISIVAGTAIYMFLIQAVFT